MPASLSPYEASAAETISRLPRSIATVVTLIESADSASIGQRIALTLVHPVFGTLYEYNGVFHYEVAPEAQKEG
ncbi:hypothetical protein [Okibacterium endophyticum]